jgi:hypothetical protein
METHVEIQSEAGARPRVSRNKSKLIGQKAPLKLKPQEIYAIRIRLQREKSNRELRDVFAPVVEQLQRRAAGMFFANLPLP